jgi:hypothetical protein
MKPHTQANLSSPVEFQRRKATFAKRGLLPMFILIVAGCTFLILALRLHNEMYALLGNLIIFASGLVFVISAKRYYRCPVCEKVVVPTRDDGKPSEISFSIAYDPQVCPYCAAALK